MALPKTNPPAGTQYEIWVKGSPEKNELGDCPFSHRTMLTMEEKGIKYHKHLLDENAMPEWVKEVCEGKKQIPFVREVESDKWMYDSDKIIPMLEDKFPEHKLGKPDDTPQVGTELFPKFMEFVSSKPGKDEDEKKQALVTELRSIDEYLANSGKPYIGGDDVCATDLRLAPQLKHVRIGSDEIKGWQVPTEFKHLLQWHDRMAQRKSWQNTQYTEQYVRDGWNLKVKKMAEEE
jgi:glutathione S-transferase